MQRRVVFRWVLAMGVAATVATGCSGASPGGWKTSKDSSGSCQVSAPADWQMGRDFFLEKENAVAGPFSSDSGLYPPRGAGLWGIDDSNPLKASPQPNGLRFEVRASVVRGGTVCSAWRIKESVDFTAQEQDTMQQVGKTLQVVQ